MTAFASFCLKVLNFQRRDRMSDRPSNLPRRIVPALFGAAAMSFACGSQAAVVQGDFVPDRLADTIPTVATVEALINAQFGTSLDLLQLTAPVFNENGSATSALGTLTSTEVAEDDLAPGVPEESVGTWTFNSADPSAGFDVNFILLKNDDSFAIWDLRAVAMSTIGCWSTVHKKASCTNGLDTIFLSFPGDDFDGLVAYSFAPIPAAGWLFLSALVGRSVVRRRSPATADA